MSSKAFGKLFKYVRNEKQMSQAELSYGICTPKTIYNIEKGNNIPSSDLMLQLANKLDINLLSILSFSDSENGLIHYKRFNHCKMLYENNSFPDLKVEADALLKTAEELNAFQLQTLYWYKGICQGAEEKKLTLAQESFRIALSFTKDMQITQIAKHYCSHQEIHILNSYGATLILLKKNEEAETLFIQLQRNFQKFGTDSKNTLFLRICYNLAKCQNKLFKPHESLKTCKIGIAIAQKNHLLNSLSELYLEMANSYDHLQYFNKRDNSLKRFIYLHEICGNEDLIKDKKSHFEKDYNIAFDEILM